MWCVVVVSGVVCDGCVVKLCVLCVLLCVVRAVVCVVCAVVCVVELCVMHVLLCVVLWLWVVLWKGIVPPNHIHRLE